MNHWPSDTIVQQETKTCVHCRHFKNRVCTKPDSLWHKDGVDIQYSLLITTPKPTDSCEDFYGLGNIEVNKQERQWICGTCAKKNGGRWPKGHLGTFHNGICDWCGKEKVVTEPRDWRLI
jgi:hypothetical protein